MTADQQPGPARVLTGRDPATGRPLAVTVRGGLIAAIGPGPADESHWLAPGLIDLQVNGFAGHDLNAEDTTPETVAALTRALHRHGVTTFVPTVVTASHRRIARALATIAAARRQDPLVRHSIPYAHLEGPHLSAQDGPRGVHPAEHIRPPSIEEFERWQQAADGLVGMVTLSPHYDEAPAYTAELTRRGVHVAIGHTHADPDQITAVADAGARLCTHLGNGAHAVLPRHPNYLWTQLADDRLTAGFIADGHHLPADTLTAMVRAKGPQRSLLVSDAVALAGMPPGRYLTPVGGSVELGADGRLGQTGTPFLAGAARGLADGVAQAVVSARLGLGEALQLATGNPGRFVGGRGRLEPGAHADLLRFAWSPGSRTLTADTVLVRGQQVSG
ncbi:N-acetylglucosamine-6-phosphate deacetylase [Streptacidiphilus sp. N1-3]|uniref:N-acetylglucosamine-6-phosphate deacetylase n=1 Tax=Streptacidiphilus alkalitolerans TaxID=3342712 RepID=A0ABV6X2N7_9ACTN